jgi:hypothetical protein
LRDLSLAFAAGHWVNFLLLETIELAICNGAIFLLVEIERARP